MSAATAIIHYPQETRQLHFTLAELGSLDQLMVAISLGRPGGSTSHSLGHQLEYEDEEGDRVRVGSEAELGALVRLMQEWSGVVHVWPDPPATPAVPPSTARRDVGRGGGLRVDTGMRRVEPLDDVACLSHALDADEGEGTIEELLSNSSLRPESLRNLQVLGSGHCGTVYKALHTTSDRLMAVKCVSLDLGPELQSSILNELRILHKCSSPFIVDFYGALIVESQISICIEYMDGGSLDGYGALPLPILSEVTVAAIAGLSYLWSVRVMHRDVKPSNLLVSSCGAVKLADFGVSAQLESSIAASYVGTNAYMAPERVMGGEYRVHSDIWSLGITLAELATGAFPFPLPSDSDQPLALLQLLLSPAPLTLPAALPADPQLRTLLSLCLRKDPALRLQPDQLAHHDFVRAHSPPKPQLVAAWLKPLIRKRSTTTPA